jgi:hypothetical protein
MHADDVVLLLHRVDALRATTPVTWGKSFAYNLSPVGSDGMLVRLSAFSYCLSPTERQAVMARGAAGARHSHVVWMNSSSGGELYRWRHAEDGRGIVVDGHQYVMFHRYFRGMMLSKSARFRREVRTARVPQSCIDGGNGVGYLVLVDMANSLREVPLVAPRSACLEKNWVPWSLDGRTLLLSQTLQPHKILSCNVSNGECRFAYGAGAWRSCPKRVWRTMHGVVAARVRGGTQIVRAGGYLIGVAHAWRPVRQAKHTQHGTHGVGRQYWHAFFAVTEAVPHCVNLTSQWFRFDAVFNDDRDNVQMATGLSVRNETDELVVTFGVGDCVSAVAVAPLAKVCDLLHQPHNDGLQSEPSAGPSIFTQSFVAS